MTSSGCRSKSNRLDRTKRIKERIRSKGKVKNKKMKKSHSSHKRKSRCNMLEGSSRK